MFSLYDIGGPFRAVLCKYAPLMAAYKGSRATPLGAQLLGANASLQYSWRLHHSGQSAITPSAIDASSSMGESRCKRKSPGLVERERFYLEMSTSTNKQAKSHFQSNHYSQCNDNTD